jgi:signal transduction histidine kinase
MSQWIERTAERLTGSKILFVLGTLIVVHFLFMLSFLHESHVKQKLNQRNSMIQKIVNVIHLIQATPVTDRAKALSATNDSALENSITEKPEWDVQVNRLSWWDINKVLHKQQNAFAISIRLLPKQWLNIKSTEYSEVLTTQFSLIAVEVFALGLVFLAGLMIKRYTRPLAAFKQAALAVRDSSTQLPEKIEGPAAVQEMVDAVISMRQRIAQQAKDRTKMLAAISHDLRTPITRMTLRAQLLGDEETREMLLRDLQEMEQMVNETLAFARADAASRQSVKVDLVSMLSSICNDQEDMGYAVHFSCEEKRIALEGKALALRRSFTNLITNACHYGDTVWVRCWLDKEKVFIEIEDNGPGIPEADLENVFEPFYRSDQSRSRNSGGIGLGLAVTRDFISLHGGAIKLSQRDKGLLATIVLPTHDSKVESFIKDRRNPLQTVA